jgi:hypothetical protein
MSGIGRFKLSDALPKAQPDAWGDYTQSSNLGARGVGKAKARTKKSTKGKPGAAHKQAAEQVREARDSARAKTNEASIRGHMVDIGRGIQQAGRQKAK